MGRDGGATQARDQMDLLPASAGEVEGLGVLGAVGLPCIHQYFPRGPGPPTLCLGGGGLRKCTSACLSDCRVQLPCTL